MFTDITALDGNDPATISNTLQSGITVNISEGLQCYNDNGAPLAGPKNFNDGSGSTMGVYIKHGDNVTYLISITAKLS